MRIVAGRFGGRRLATPRDTRVRPTADRVREAWMSMLADAVPGARVLDLFAGSGALGLEALSRGAAEATFVDSAAASVAAVRANLEAVGGEAEVRRADALRFLGSAAGETRHYDLVLLDPPYRLAERLGRDLSEALPPVLAPSALVVSESDRRAPLSLDLPLKDERRYGDTLIRIHEPR